MPGGRQSAPGEVQVGRCRIRLGADRVLGDPAVADLAGTEQASDDVERGLDDGADLRPAPRPKVHVHWRSAPARSRLYKRGCRADRSPSATGGRGGRGLGRAAHARRDRGRGRGGQAEADGQRQRGLLRRNGGLPAHEHDVRTRLYAPYIERNGVQAGAAPTVAKLDLPLDGRVTSGWPDTK